MTKQEENNLMFPKEWVSNMKLGAATIRDNKVIWIESDKDKSKTITIGNLIDNDIVFNKKATKYMKEFFKDFSTSIIGYAEPIKEDLDFEKCKTNLYYFATNYLTINGKKFTTRLSEEKFNKSIEIYLKNIMI